MARFPFATSSISSRCCSSAAAPPVPDRSQLIRGILASTVQLRSEHEAGFSRAASGVVVATHYASRRMWIATARHFLEPSRPQQLYVRLAGQTSMAPATIAFVSGDRDLAIIETEYADVTPARLTKTVCPTQGSSTAPTAGTARINTIDHHR